METIKTQRKLVNMIAGCICVLGLAVFLFSSLPGYSQVVGGSLSGSVTDNSGSAIPNASVSIQNVATGVSTAVTTNDQGIYNAPNLLPGTYQTTVSAPGFQRAVENGVILSVGAQRVLNVSMAVGSISQSVEVTAEAPDVQLASSTINGVVSSNTIVELPLNGRSWTDLATLQPGVSTIHGMVSVTSADRLGRGLGTELSIAGGRPQQNN